MVGKVRPLRGGSFICTFCRLRPSTKPKTRSFATSTPQRAIPPESPNFVDVPASFQPDLYIPRRAKGKLPVPRELFPRQRPDKPSQTYIENVTPDKKPENLTPPSHQTPLSQHRRRMSSLRKEHLRSSLVDLHARKEYITRQIDARSTAKLEESERLRHQPPREDERLTNPSIPTSMLPGSCFSTPELLDETAATAISARKQARVAHAASRRDEMDEFALHALYMNARRFITTEEQLLGEIEREFLPPGQNAEFRSGDWTETGENIWVKGVPATVKDLIRANTVQSPRNGMQPGPADLKVKFRRDQERMKAIAEVLTGGKI